MELRANLLKVGIDEGRVPVGCNIDESKDLGMVRAIASAGADFLFVDLEHRPHDLSSVFEVLWHGYGAGLSSIVRVPAPDYPWVQRVLDAGAENIVIPHVTRREDVERALDLARYFPRGSRGMGMYGGASVNYQKVTDFARAAEWVNDNLLVGIIIEDAVAVENVEDLLVDGVGFAIVGFHDLAQSYGIIGDFGDERIVQARQRVLEVCRERGIAYIAPAVNPADAARSVAAGAAAVLFPGVLAMVRDALSASIEGLRSDSLAPQPVGT